jgi:hypothetical protein
MRIIPRACLMAGLLSLPTATFVSCQSGSPTATAADGHAFFQSEVRPILEMNCLPCHNGTTLPGRLNLTTRAATLAGRAGNRAYLVPGRPDDSLLVTAVSRTGTHPKLMPQRDLSLTEEDIGTLREWIEDGAPWPSGPDGTLRPKPNPETPRPGM